MIYGPKIGISCHSPLSLSKRHGNWPTQIVSEVSGDFLSLTHRLARLFDGSVPKKIWGADISRLQFLFEKKNISKLVGFRHPPLSVQAIPSNKKKSRSPPAHLSQCPPPTLLQVWVDGFPAGTPFGWEMDEPFPFPFPFFLGGYNMTPTNKTMKPMPLNLPHTVFLYEVRSPPKWVI